MIEWECACVYSNLLLVVSVCLFKWTFNGAIPSVRHTRLNSLWTDWQCASWTAGESEVWIMFEHEECMSTAVLNRDLVKQNLENDSENGIHEVLLNRFTLHWTKQPILVFLYIWNVLYKTHRAGQLQSTWSQQLLFISAASFSPRVGRDGGLRHSSTHCAVDGPASAPEVGTTKRCCCCCGCCCCRRVGKPWDWRRRRKRGQERKTERQQRI